MMSISNQVNILQDVASAKNGNTQAFIRLIDQTRNMVSSIALAIVKDLDNSEEVAQQVFISIWENLNQLKNNTSFFPWLRQMTRNKAYNFLRDNKVARKIVGEQADILLAQFCDPKSALSEVIERQQQSLILNNFISELPSDSREIVLLYYREEQSTKQVAELLELSEANVRKKLSRIRALLKTQILQKYGKLVFSSAPTLAFSSFFLGSLTTTTPVAAATMSSSLAATKTGIVAKLGWLFGGAMIGVFGGIMSMVWASKIPLQKITHEEAKKTYKRYRNQSVVWIAVTGLLFALSYEVTSGWIGPVFTYSLLAIGLMVYIHKMGKFASNHIYGEKPSADSSDKKRVDNMWMLLGIFFGGITGFTGLIIGLINSGRL